jgi:PAS domain S-box-containing protein
MNKLLTRQIKRHFGSLENLPIELEGIIADINNSYENFEDDAELLQNSIEISSQELRTAYEKHKQDAETQKETFSKIQHAISAFNTDYKKIIIEDEPTSSENNLLFNSLIRLIEERKQADNEIKKLSLAIEQSPVVIIIADLKGNIEYVNPAFNAVTGYQFDEILGQNMRILKSGETSPTVYADLWVTITAGNDWHGEWINKKKNGELYWENVAVTPVRDINGEITNYLAIKQDITQRKQIEDEIRDLNANLEISITERTAELTRANKYLNDEIEERKRIELALIKSEKSYRTVVENVNEIIFQTDTEGLWIFLNKSWESITGFSVQESLGQLISTHIHPDDWDLGGELFKQLISRQNDFCQNEIRFITKDGGFRWIEVFARVALNDNDEVTGTYGTLMDITERKNAEDKINHISDRLALALRIGGTGVWECNLEKNILLWDNQMFALYGMKDENFGIGYEVWLNNLHPDDKLRADEEIQMAIQGEKEFDTEFRVIWSDGSIHFIRALAKVLRDDSGRALGLIGTNSDITDQKLAADFQNEMLQLSTKLTGIASSEINKALELALSRIGQFLNADRSYIFEFDSSQVYMNNTFEWCSPGVIPHLKDLQNIPVEMMPNLMENLKKHQNIVIPSVQELPESWRGEREIFELQNIKSLVTIPLLVENNIIGFVGIDSVLTQRDYNSKEINILKVWSSMLASLIQNKRAEGLLEQTRQNYETFFNTIDDFLWVLDKEGNVIHMNNTATNRLEYSAEELLNKPVLMLHQPERRDEAGRLIGEVLAGISEFSPVQVVSKSGKSIPVETKVKPGFWDGQEVIFAVSKDISKIKISEEKFSRAFQSNSVLMAISTIKEGIFLEVNDSFVKNLDYSREEIIGKKSSTFKLLEDSEVRKHIGEKLINKSILSDIEIELSKKDGSKMIGLFSSDTITIGDDLCILIMIVDISSRKQAEIEIRKTREEAEKANMAKSEFLSRMSHELRTPMNSILGFAQLLEMDDLDPDQTKGVKHIMKSGKHLLDLINEVLEISRIEAGHISLSIEPVLVSEVIQEMIEFVIPLASNRQIKIEFEATADDQIFVKTDRQRFKQVLLNLINNAIKYNKQGGSIYLKAEIMPANHENIPLVRISVKDTGHGISSTDMPKLFMPFERIGADKTLTEGTGLGLTVVKRIMDALGGTIGIESVLDQGSTFWIELPSIESPLENIQKMDGLTNSESNLVKKKGAILYIEDNTSNIELVQQILSKQRPHIQLTAKMYGNQAVQSAIDLNPDLILLDLDLPDIHGSEVLKRLQAEVKTMGIPVVIISADAMPQQIRKLLKAGVQDYLTKPLEINDFLKIIDKFIVG